MAFFQKEPGPPRAIPSVSPIAIMLSDRGRIYTVRRRVCVYTYDFSCGNWQTVPYLGIYQAMRSPSSRKHDLVLKLIMEEGLTTIDGKCLTEAIQAKDGSFNAHMFSCIHGDMRATVR